MKTQLFLALSALIVMGVVSCASVPPADAMTVELASTETTIIASPATPLRRGPPQFPGSAARNGHQAVCALVFDVDEVGVPQNICVTCAATGSRQGFERAAREMLLRQWRYTPAVSGEGVAVVAVGVKSELEFLLSEQPDPHLSAPDPFVCEAPNGDAAAGED